MVQIKAKEGDRVENPPDPPPSWCGEPYIRTKEPSKLPKNPEKHVCVSMMYILHSIKRALHSIKRALHSIQRVQLNTTRQRIRFPKKKWATYKIWYTFYVYIMMNITSWNINNAMPYGLCGSICLILGSWAQVLARKNSCGPICSVFDHQLRF